MPRIAFMTFGILREPYRSDVVQGFVALNPPVIRRAEEAPGFLRRAVRPDLTNPGFGQDYGDWGAFSVLPRFYEGGVTREDYAYAVTLSLWESIDTVRDFAYGGLHATALAQRHKWFLDPQWPTYVMWWVDDTQTPQWTHAVSRLEYLHDNGATPHAFSFRQPFDPDGAPLPPFRH